MEDKIHFNSVSSTNSEKKTYLDMAGEWRFLDQIPKDIYSKGDRIILNIKDAHVRDVNDFITTNYLKIIQSNETSVIVEFTETMRHYPEKRGNEK